MRNLENLIAVFETITLMVLLSQWLYLLVQYVKGACFTTYVKILAAQNSKMFWIAGYERYCLTSGLFSLGGLHKGR